MLLPWINYIKKFLSFALAWWREIVIFALILTVLHYNTTLKNERKEHVGEIAKRDVANLKLRNDISKAEKEYLEKINQLNKQASYEVEKLQEKHDNEIEKLEHRSAVLNNSVDSLQQTLKRNRSDFRDSAKSGTTNQHPSNAESLFNATSESFGECVKEYSTMAEIADKQQVSINTLQESWEAVRKQYNSQETKLDK